MVSRRGARGLAVSPPEDEEERRQRRRGEIRREGDSPAPLTADDGRPGAEAAANVLASLDELVFSEDASVHGPTETLEEGTGGRVGPIAALGRVAREDPLVMTPELHEDRLDGRYLAKDVREPCCRDGLALAVGEDDDELACETSA